MLGDQTIHNRLMEMKQKGVSEDPVVNDIRGGVSKRLSIVPNEGALRRCGQHVEQLVREGDRIRSKLRKR